MGGGSGAGGAIRLCNDPDHSEPFACFRQAEGGLVCESTHQLEKIIYCITEEPRLFRWNSGKIEWSPNIEPPIWKELPWL